MSRGLLEAQNFGLMGRSVLKRSCEVRVYRDVTCEAVTVGSCALAHWQATLCFVQRGHYDKMGSDW